MSFIISNAGRGSSSDGYSVKKTGDTMSGALLLPDGTVSLPALSFSADTNTGMYRSGADTLDLVVGGAKSLELGTATVSAVGQMVVKNSSNNATSALHLQNLDTSSGVLGATGVTFQLADTSGDTVAGASIKAGKEHTWTSTASTQDGYLAFFTATDGLLSERARFDSAGSLTFTNASTNAITIPTSGVIDVSGGAGTVQFSNFGSTAYFGNAVVRSQTGYQIGGITSQWNSNTMELDTGSVGVHRTLRLSAIAAGTNRNGFGVAYDGYSTQEGFNGITKFKPSDQIIGNAAAQNDNDFQFTLDANSMYAIDAALDGYCTSGEGFRYDFGGTVGFLNFWCTALVGDVVNQDINMYHKTQLNGGSSGGTMSAADNYIVIIKGQIETSVSGTFIFKFHSSSGATATKIKRGSWMKLQKL